MNQKVDLLVVNYNTKDLLSRLVDTLHESMVPGQDVPWNLYISDNGSTDGSREMIEAWSGDHGLYKIEHAWINSNIGYAGAINRMAAATSSEFLCAVNADTWFTTNHVSEVIDTFNENKRAGVVGVKQMDEQSRIRHGGIFWDGKTNPVHRHWAMSDPDDRLCKDIQQCWTVSGSIYYVRRSAWNEMTYYKPYNDLFPGHEGAFLPTPHYFEETFCSQLAHHLGWEVWYDGTVETAGHSWHASTEKNGHGGAEDYFAISKKIYVDACNALSIPHEC